MKKLAFLVLGALVAILGGAEGAQDKKKAPNLEKTLKSLESEDADVRSKAARTLAGMDLDEKAEQAKLIIKALLPLVKDGEMKVRKDVAAALGKVGKADVEMVVPALIGLLKDSDELVQIAAAQGLGKIGPAAKDAIEPLTKLQKNTINKRVRSEINKVLPMIQPK